MEREEKLREIREAIDAGNLVKKYLSEARKHLDSAAGFGWADIAGIDLIGGIGKHIKISSAKTCIEEAREAFPRFQKELLDVSENFDINLDIGGFMGFADVFMGGMGGLAVDFLVQKRIEDAKREVQNAMWWVGTALEKLAELYESVRRE